MSSLPSGVNTIERNPRRVHVCAIAAGPPTSGVCVPACVVVDIAGVGALGAGSAGFAGAEQLTSITTQSARQDLESSDKPTSVPEPDVSSNG